MAQILATLLTLFVRIPPQLRGAGATGAIFAAAAAAFAAQQHELAALLAILWAAGLIFELAVLPKVKAILSTDANGDGTPDALAKFQLPPGITWTDVRLLLGHVQRVGLERVLDVIMRLPARPRPPEPPNLTSSLLLLFACCLLTGCAGAQVLCAQGIDLTRFVAGVEGSGEGLEIAQSTVTLGVCGLPITVESYVTSDEVTVCVSAPLLGTKCDGRPL